MPLKNTTEEPMPQEDWFDNVENLRPLRGGRRASTLNEIATGALRVSAEAAEKKFLDEFAAAKNQDDPLAIMYDFANWFQEYFPSGKHKVFYPILYKICTTYCVMERYKNDERMLKLWLKLVESYPESGLAVMEFAYTKGSCRQLAKFYVRWSEMYQSIGYFNRAKEKLELGLAMFATPLTLLNAAMDQLTEQLRYNDEQKNLEEEEQFAERVESCRETLGRLRGLGRKQAAPIVRIAQGPPGRVERASATKSNCRRQFDVFVDDSPAPTMAQRIAAGSGTPAVRRRLADDLKDDPDYQALFGFFDHREKVDLDFSTVENASKTSCKIVSTGTATKGGSRPQNLECEFEVYEDEPEVNKEEKPKQKANSKEKSKARLMVKKCFVMETSIEEGYAKRIYAESECK